ncbi:EpsG family protein [Marinobacter nanhaiticus]|nr:EpsG family protein [Marinobacter nanhaiticus]
MAALFIVLAIFSGIRAESVGTDTSAYYIIFNYLTSSAVNPFLTRYEPGFVMMNLVSNWFGWGPSGVIFLSSSLFSLLIVLAAHRFSTNHLVFFSVFLGLSFYIFSFNGVRQALAMAFVLNGLNLYSGKDKKGIVWCLTAILFHLSAIFFLVSFVFLRLRLKAIAWLLVWSLSIFIMIDPDPLKYVIDQTSYMFPSSYQVYFGDYLWGSYGSLEVRDLFYQFLFFVALYSLYVFRNNSMCSMVSILVMSAVIFKNIFLHFGFIERLSLYFEIFIPLYLGYVTLVFRHQVEIALISFGFSALMFILYIRAISGNSNGVLPYSF